MYVCIYIYICMFDYLLLISIICCPLCVESSAICSGSRLAGLLLMVRASPGDVKTWLE